MSLAGVLTNCLCYLNTFNFYFSMTFQFFTFLLAEGWMSPAVAMISYTIDPQYKGVAIAVFLCATAMFGSLGIFIVGKVQTEYELETQEDKGKLLAANTAIPSAIAAILFFISGIFYARVKREMETEKEEALEKSKPFEFEKEEGETMMSYGQF